MSMPPPPLGENWKHWGERLNAFLSGSRGKLDYRTTGDSAAEDGILMWDRALGTLVVSKNGTWVKVKLDP